ncbi:phosphate propanoyltransferase [Bacillus songklensis]|uniref:Phosphate propanoyltransferase n=1 Tax=Bacillus songklensis TaxID=1069116 RepID=A0ABV8B8L2_9BACI
MALITEKHLRAMIVKKVLPNPFLLAPDDKLTPAAKDFLRERSIEVTRTESKDQVTAKPGIGENIPVGVSNRHIHLSEKDVEMLFGFNHSLTPLKPLSQPGQFAAAETVTLVGPKGALHNVRVLGPARSLTQVEISRTDGFLLGVHPPVRLSGTIEGTPGIAIVGPKGCLTIEEGVIVARNHVHMSPEDAKRFQVNHGDRLIVQTMTDRTSIFPEVIVRIDERFKLDLHIDHDEANASCLKTGDCVEVIGKNGELFSPFLGGK